MAGGDERKRELLWFEYRGQQFMVPEDDAKEYKLSFRFLRLDNTTMVLLNNVANLVDVKSGLTTCDKRRLQELLGPVGNTKADSIKIDLVPVQGAEHGWVWSAGAEQAGAEFGRHRMCSRDGYRFGTAGRTAGN